LLFTVIELAGRIPGRRSGLERLNRGSDDISQICICAVPQKAVGEWARELSRGTTLRSRDKRARDDMIYLYQIDTLIHPYLTSTGDTAPETTLLLLRKRAIDVL
jgi:hypothetical protein